MNHQIKVKQEALRRLTNNMRLYAETNVGFERLKNVDLEEAIDNLVNGGVKSGHWAE